MQELDYNPSKKDLTDARIHHLLAEELKPYRRVSWHPLKHFHCFIKETSDEFKRFEVALMSEQSILTHIAGSKRTYWSVHDSHVLSKES